MANYTKSTNFAVKDTLTTGDPQKIVSGVEIDTEFVNISSMSSTKIDKVGGATAGNVATLTAGGSIQDSGDSIADIAYGTDDLKTDLNATGDQPLYAVRAWVNIQADVNPPVIRDSGNVSSVTRVASGRNKINFTTAFDDNNYSATGSQDASDTSNGRILVINAYQPESVNTLVTSDAGTATLINSNTISVQIVQ